MRKLKTLIIAAALLIIAGAAMLVFNSLGNKIESQKAAQRWSGGGENFAQVTRYCPVGEDMGFSDIYNLRKQIDAALVQNSITSKWTDCFCLRTAVNVSGSHASSNAETYAFGGDFFLFHPLFLIDGQYISENDLSRDRVVITKTLAWKLFGSTMVSGMPITVDGRNFIVAGVVEEESDSFDKKAHASSGECMYVLYDSLFSYYDDTNITCYEMVLPEPVDGFAMNMLKNVGTGDYVQNSGRFKMGSIYKVIGDYGERSMNTLGVIYPYWENAARSCEDWLALPLIIATLAVVFPIVYAVGWFIIVFQKGRKFLGRKIAENRMH